VVVHALIPHLGAHRGAVAYTVISVGILDNSTIAAVAVGLN
jgi:hypothetical protein